MIDGGRFLLRENLLDTDPTPLQNADFKNLFSLVAPQA